MLGMMLRTRMRTVAGPRSSSMFTCVCLELVDRGLKRRKMQFKGNVKLALTSRGPKHRLAAPPPAHTLDLMR